MPIGTLVAATPEFLRWLRELSDDAPIQVNQGGIVRAVGHYATIVHFASGDNFGVPHGMALRMAQHERDLTQCVKLLAGYRRMGGFK